MSVKFNVGDRVRIRGDASDFTEHLDGVTGTVVAIPSSIEPVDYIVAVDRTVPGLDTWRIWEYNLELLEEAGK